MADKLNDKVVDDSGTVENDLTENVDDVENTSTDDGGMDVEPAEKNINLTADDIDGDASVLLDKLGLSDTSSNSGDTSESDDTAQTDKTDREKELEDRLSEMGRELKELKMTVQNPVPIENQIEREPTGDPIQDNFNLLADSFVEISGRLDRQEKMSTAVESYMDQGIDRKTARDLADLEMSNSIQDRIKWHESYSAAKNEVDKRDSVRRQQLEDRGSVHNVSGQRGSGTTTSAPDVSAAVVASKIRDKFNNGGDQVDAAFGLEDVYGEDFIDEVISHLGK